MYKSLNISKRILVMMLACWIAFTSVFFAYQETTQAAEWVAGAIATIGGAPIMTALVIGGVVVAGGIAIHELSQTSADDYRAFYEGIKNGFQGFVAEQEAQIAKEQNSSLTDQEAADIGVANARDTINNFTKNAIDVGVTTGKNLKAKAVEYWKLFCGITGNIADVGLIDGEITDTTPIKPKTSVINGNYNFSVLDNIGANTIEYDGNSYLVKGQYQGYTNGQWVTHNVDTSTVSTDRIRLPYMFFFPLSNNREYHVRYRSVDINKLTGEVIAFTNSTDVGSYGIGSYASVAEAVNVFTSRTNLPVIVNLDPGNSNDNISTSTYAEMLAVGLVSASVPQWKRTVNDVLSNTHIGNAIQTGRRVLVNEGDEITSVFQQDSIPTKKTGVTVQDGVMSAPVGWDIPLGGVYDDVFRGALPWSKVLDGVGTVEVPSDDVIGTTDNDTRVEAPADTVVNDPSYPRDDPDDPTQNPPNNPTWEDVFNNQGGLFYPEQMDLTKIFPFCIPFDIIYLVDKFGNTSGIPPRLEIPIVYPELLQPTLGEAYIVVIDFADYVVVKDVIRVFLLLLFIVGLMQITRQLIRG